MTDPTTPRSIPIMQPSFPDSMLDDLLCDLRQVLASGRIAPGAMAAEFERDFAALCGTDYAVAVNSATTGLQIALRYFGAAGGEVLVPAASFITDVSAVMFECATPVLADIDPATMAVSPETLEARVTDATRGIIWVHLTGLVSRDFEQIRDFAASRGLFLIEDASHAHGARAGDRTAGRFGDVGVFSFFPTKLMTTGSGGMLTTSDPELARFAREMRMFGKDQQTGEILHLGNDWFLDDLRSCVGLHQLRGLPDNLARRGALARRYFARLANQPGLRVLDVPDDHAPSWYQFPVFIDDPAMHAACLASMKSAGVQVKPIYTPVHKERVFRGFDNGSTPKAERMLDSSLCLPMFASLAEDDADYVADRLIATLRGAG